MKKSIYSISISILFISRVHYLLMPKKPRLSALRMPWIKIQMGLFPKKNIFQPAQNGASWKRAKNIFAITIRTKMVS